MLTRDVVTVSVTAKRIVKPSSTLYRDREPHLAAPTKHTSEMAHHALCRYSPLDVAESFAGICVFLRRNDKKNRGRIW